MFCLSKSGQACMQRDQEYDPDSCGGANTFQNWRKPNRATFDEQTNPN